MGESGSRLDESKVEHNRMTAMNHDEAGALWQRALRKGVRLERRLTRGTFRVRVCISRAG